MLATFPLWYLLLPFAMVLFATSIFAFFNLYHVAKFGMQTFTTTLVLGAYLVSYLALVAFSGLLFSTMNWQQRISLPDILPYSSGAASRYGL